MDTTTKRSRGRPRAFNPNPEQTTIQALDRAMGILKVLAGGEGMSLTELAEATGQAPATVYRVLSTFEAHGIVEVQAATQLWFVGQEAFHLNAELRFPLIEAMATPIGILGGVRGTFFFGVGGAHFDSQSFKVYETNASIEAPIVGYTPGQNPEPIFGQARVVDGFRLVDARASYGVSLQTFALGFPVHFDWSWKTLFNRDWEDVLFSLAGGSSEFRKVKFTMWIGYDF